MARRYRDLVYLTVVGAQLFGMLALDLVQFYPAVLWKAPSAPLHFLVSLRHVYVSVSGDPFFASAAHEPWFEALIYIELFAQLPLAAFLVTRLGSSSSKSTSARTELAALAFGCLTGMGSLVCCSHLLGLGQDVVSAENKAMLVYGEYLPFAIIPTLMAFDMYSRLVTRIDQAEKPKKQ